jgi:hypothetical protein
MDYSRLAVRNQHPNLFRFAQNIARRKTRLVLFGRRTSWCLHFIVARMLLVPAIYPDDAWARFGVTIWLGPAFAAVGALIGFGVALRWTKPPASER